MQKLRHGRCSSLALPLFASSFTVLSKRFTTLSFFLLMRTFYGVCYLFVTSFKWSGVNKHWHFRRIWKPFWLSAGKSMQTHLLGRSLVHPRVIIYLWSEYIMFALPRWKASGDVCSTVHVYQFTALYSSVHSSTFKQAFWVVTPSQRATLLTLRRVHN